MALGDTLGAIRAFEHYLAFRVDPEASLSDEVEGIRRRLAELRRTREGLGA